MDNEIHFLQIKFTYHLKEYLKEKKNYRDFIVKIEELREGLKNDEIFLDNLQNNIKEFYNENIELDKVIHKNYSSLAKNVRNRELLQELFKFLELKG